MQEAGERLGRWGTFGRMLPRGDGWAGFSAGRFSFHSAMASFMRGGELLPGLQEVLWLELEGRRCGDQS